MQRRNVYFLHALWFEIYRVFRLVRFQLIWFIWFLASSNTNCKLTEERLLLLIQFIKTYHRKWLINLRLSHFFMWLLKCWNDICYFFFYSIANLRSWKSCSESAVVWRQIHTQNSVTIPSTHCISTNFTMPRFSSQNTSGEQSHILFIRMDNVKIISHILKAINFKEVLMNRHKYK